jgi:hypothetical protein
MNPQTIAALTAAAVLVLAGCGSGSRPMPRDAADCLAAVGAVIRNAPPSADDPATGPWLGQVDHLRDMAKAAGDVTSRQLAGELDWAGALVAVDNFPPQLAIVPAQETCSTADPSTEIAPLAAVPASRAWLTANPPSARPGMTAGIVTGWTDVWLGCPAGSHGSEVAAGGGCEAWLVTLTTATGVLRASCGDITDGVACTSATARVGPHQYFPTIGDELYVPEDGRVTGSTDITIISQPPWGSF